jgi:hypothetical protein
MQSPPAEWLLFGAHFVVLDYLRSRGDADSDTLSEVVRDLTKRHPRGEQAFTVALIAGAIALRRHIIRP